MGPNKKLDQYLKKIAKGDKDALKHIYYETNDSVYFYALSILKNKDDAKDVMQETYINIFNNIDSYKSKSKPLAWILTITKNNALMHLRKSKREVNLEDYENIFEKKDNVDTKLFLSYLFEHIEEDERHIVLLHAVSGFKHREISKLLNIPLGTVLSKYKRTIKKLKEIGKDYYEK